MLQPGQNNVICGRGIKAALLLSSCNGNNSQRTQSGLRHRMKWQDESAGAAHPSSVTDNTNTRVFSKLNRSHGRKLFP